MRGHILLASNCALSFSVRFVWSFQFSRGIRGRYVPVSMYLTVRNTVVVGVTRFFFVGRTGGIS
jgi:hypothetical protein